MSAVTSALPAMRSSASDLLNNGIATAARLLAGTVLFVVMGRLLGPAAFGEFMSAMAIAALIAFGSNFGFTQQALREVAAHRAEATDIADGLASAKVTLAVLVVVASLIIALALGGVWWLIAVLTLALICDGAVEFLFALLKGHGHYGVEAGFASVASVAHFVVVGGVCVYAAQPMAIAVAFLISRALQLTAAAWACSTRIALPRLNLPWSRQWTQVRTGWAYGVDAGLGQLTTQSDTVLVRVLLGAHAAGIYQAGMRVLIGLLTLSVVAGNVFIPRLARTLPDPLAHNLVVGQLNRVYLALALASGAGLWGLGWLFVHYGYGAAYAELSDLWPWLAALITVRVLAASQGVRLTAIGQQAIRSAVNIGALTISVALIVASVSLGWGLVGVIASLSASSLFVLAVYRWRVLWTRTRA